MESLKTCAGCGAKGPNDGKTWWNLNRYYSISGLLCQDCYDKVSHDSYNRPKRPNDYLLMRLKLFGK